MTIPLPEPQQLQVVHTQYPCSFIVTGYAADDMLAYGDARAAEERERCAKVCERVRMVKGGEVFAAAIRAGS